MAKKNIYTGTIDKHTDWGGDASTDYAPVAGESVQQFIKDTFDQKVGIFYYDVSNNRYLTFADNFTKEEYLKDPSKTNLILGTFDAPFNYTASISLTSSYYNAVFLNSTGNYIDFTFDVVNKQGASTGENVTITYTFIRNASKKTVTEIRKFREVVHFNVDKYLEEGTNNIIIGIMGQTTLAATTIAVTYQVVNLFISDELNIAKSYNLSNEEKQLEVPFTVSGYGTKRVEWYIDGKLLEFIQAEDEVVDVSTTRTKYITLSNLNQGTHSLQIRAYTSINGEKFYTDTLYRDLLIYTGSSNNVIIGIATTIPREYGIIQPDEEVSIYEMIQYIPYSLRFATYSPSNAANTEVVVKLDGNILNTINSKNDIENEVIIVSKTSGNKTLELISGDISKNIVVSVKNTSINIHEIEGATLDFPSTGRLEGNTWTDDTYIGTFEGFNWNSTSGWVNGRLEMNAGSSLHINYAPLNNNPTNLGKTIEIEWSTKNVKNDNAIICDLRGSNGVGILITATKVSMISSNGAVIETEYRSDENVRIGFVINKSSGTANKRLSFIYINGIISRATQWSEYDNYNSDKEIVFTATEEAEISLKSIRIYDNALSSDNMLNNFILYRDTISEMMEVYTRNDIYEEGTTTFSPDKMMNRLPVMIVTGDIPILENTSNKNEQIVVDIEYYNIQDPSKNFTMKNAAMRPQGTSSMYYPKKNFRIYTQELEDTKLYDYTGNLIESRLYSFKDKAQPVNCWCLKADYAESSGTHNTGIARLWNDALFNARVTHYFGKDDPKNIDNQTVLRTEAQQKAIDNKYEYDVRTTIDGFPILLFYKKNINDDLIFIGKYNFNNDKSTESVFGFKDVPGFDNSSMQCWEVLHNGNPLALFTSFDDFDNKWSEAFESRYPSKDPKIEDLKAFCKWMVEVTEEEFAEQKWGHLDVYKMAAYWIYLMRHAAADQFVKNAMFTSEDGEHFYYILYDNDTINGLINSGYLTIKPTDDRQTKNDAGVYVFAGHDSKLWNYLEKDKEFLSIVSSVDNALYSAGISYSNTIKIFDESQADKWVEKVYNQDAQYKYIGPYVEKGVNNLFMLQGKRDIHRKWWLAKRFSIYDAKYVSGSYKSDAIVIKLEGTTKGKKFSIKAGYPLDYGYGINNIPREYGIYLNVGETHEFTISDALNIGDPLSIYGSPNISEIDLSGISENITYITIEDINNINLGTKLTKLILGNPTSKNASVSEISGLIQAENLEELDIQNMTKLIAIDLSNQKYFKKLKAYGSSVTSITFAKGATVEHLEMPSTMKSLILEQLPYLNYDKIYFEDISALSTINVKSCPKISNNFSLIKQWVDNKITSDNDCTLIMDNINWNDVSPADLVKVGQLGNISLKGKVSLTEISDEYVNTLSNLFGDNAFDKNSEFYIDAPASLYIQGPTTLLDGESATYKLLLFGGEIKGNPIWGVKLPVSGITFDTTNQYLETIETGVNRSITLTLTVLTDKGAVTTELTVYVNAKTYPSGSHTNIIGDSRLGESGEIAKDENILGGSIYKLEITNDVNGEYYVEWALSGLEGYTFTKSIPEDTHYYIIGITLYPDNLVTGTITASIYKKSTSKLLFTKTKTIELINEDIAETDPGICAAFYDKGYIANKSYMTKEEALLFTEDILQPGTGSSTSIFASYTSQIKSFNGFKYFTNVKKIKLYTFRDCRSLTSVTIPNSVTSIGEGAFQNCKILTSITIPSSVTSIGSHVFDGCSGLKSIIIPNSITYITDYAFWGCSSLTSVTIPDSVTSIGASVFSRCSNLTSITIGNSVTSIGGSAFSGCSGLNTIICKALTAPSVSSSTFGNSTSTYTGYNTRGQNVLYVPANSTGYDTGYWLDPLCNADKCGFTLSKTL